jgi:hypothetical protein
MAERGRPPKGVARSNILLRMPTDLIEQVDTFKESLEAERGGFVINRTDILIRLIEVGLQTLTQARQPATQPAPVRQRNGQGATPAPAVPRPQRAETAPAKRPAKHALPREVLERIADERTHCEGLSLSQFAQRLHEKGIYSATAKDGSKVPPNKGNVTKWLEQAREAELL